MPDIQPVFSQKKTVAARPPAAGPHNKAHARHARISILACMHFSPPWTSRLPARRSPSPFWHSCLGRRAALTRCAAAARAQEKPQPARVGWSPCCRMPWHAGSARLLCSRSGALGLHGAQRLGSPGCWRAAPPRGRPRSVLRCGASAPAPSTPPPWAPTDVWRCPTSLPKTPPQRRCLRLVPANLINMGWHGDAAPWSW